MAPVGAIESLWRYPVKSMAGEQLAAAFVGFGGVHGDRLYAFRGPASPPGFPYLTARERHAMLLHRPRFRHPDRAAMPPNLAAARELDPIIAPVPAQEPDLALDVETPDGRVLAIDDPALARGFGEGVVLLRSDKAIADCRPLSLLSLQSVRTLGDELGGPVDKRRFRANVYLDLGSAPGFAEDGFLDKTLRLGSEVEVRIVARDPRCAMTTLDPDTGTRDFRVLKTIGERHGGTMGLYAAVIAEGVVRAGDEVAIVG